METRWWGGFYSMNEEIEYVELCSLFSPELEQVLSTGTKLNYFISLQGAYLRCGEQLLQVPEPSLRPEHLADAWQGQVLEGARRGVEHLHHGHGLHHGSGRSRCGGRRHLMGHLLMVLRLHGYNLAIQKRKQMIIFLKHLSRYFLST